LFVFLSKSVAIIFYYFQRNFTFSVSKQCEKYFEDIYIWKILKFNQQRLWLKITGMFQSFVILLLILSVSKTNENEEGINKFILKNKLQNERCYKIWSISIYSNININIVKIIVFTDGQISYTFSQQNYVRLTGIIFKKNSTVEFHSNPYLDFWLLIKRHWVFQTSENRNKMSGNFERANFSIIFRNDSLTDLKCQIVRYQGKKLENFCCKLEVFRHLISWTQHWWTKWTILSQFRIKVCCLLLIIWEALTE